MTDLEFACVNDNDGKNKQDKIQQQQKRGRYSIIHVETKFFFSFFFPGTLGSDQELIIWRQQASGYGWKLGKNAAWFREEISSKRIHLFLFYTVLEVWTVHVWWWLFKTEARPKGNFAINRTGRYRSRFRVFLWRDRNSKQTQGFRFFEDLWRYWLGHWGQQKCKSTQRDKHLYSAGYCKRSLGR